MEWQVVGYCLIPLIGKEILQPPQRVCKMSFKSKGCKDCHMRSCCDLAERNARLWLQGKVTKERFQELTQDLHNTCHIAGIYQDWLVSSLKSDLPLTSSKRFHTKAKDRKKLLLDMLQCLAIHWPRWAATLETRVWDILWAVWLRRNGDEGFGNCIGK